MSSLVDPGSGVVVPGAELGGSEPKGDLSVGGLDGIGAVADVTADIDAVVTTDGAGLGVEGLGSTEHLAAGEDGVVTLPDHSADGAGGHVLDETREESLAGEVSVMLLHVGLSWGAELHGDELEALLLEALEDGANESSLDTVRLDHDEGSLLLGGSVDHCVCFVKNLILRPLVPTITQTQILKPQKTLEPLKTQKQTRTHTHRAQKVLHTTAMAPRSPQT